MKLLRNCDSAGKALLHHFKTKPLKLQETTACSSWHVVSRTLLIGYVSRQVRQLHPLICPGQFPLEVKRKGLRWRHGGGCGVRRSAASGSSGFSLVRGFAAVRGRRWRRRFSFPGRGARPANAERICPPSVFELGPLAL